MRHRCNRTRFSPPRFIARRPSRSAKAGVDKTARALAVAYLVGGLALVVMRFADWRLVAPFLVSVAVSAAIVSALKPDGYGVWLHLVHGTTVAGAFFIITDPVIAPAGTKARVVYAGIIGLLTVVIREYGGCPDGLAFAVLLGNACAPALERAHRVRAAELTGVTFLVVRIFFPHVRALAVAITAAALIAQGMWLLTRDDIEQNERHKVTAVLAKMYAPLEGTERQHHRLNPSARWITREMVRLDDATQVFVLSPWLSPAGYNGPLSLVVVAGRDARPIAVRVTSHRETPGIGDQFAHDDGRWLGQLEGMTAAQIRNASAVLNDQGFDIMTGATVTLAGDWRRSRQRWSLCMNGTTLPATSIGCSVYD